MYKIKHTSSLVKDPRSATERFPKAAAPPAKADTEGDL